MNAKWTFLILMLAVLGLFMLNAWIEVIQLWLFKTFHLDESASNWLIVAIASTALFVLLLGMLNIELHDVVGISETVDRQLTGEREQFRRGKVVQIQTRKR